MSAFQRVIDYMAGMPDAANHREIFYEKFLERNATSAVQQIDGVSMEKKLLSPAERNVIQALNTQTKFTLNNMKDGFLLNAVISARTNDQKRDRVDRRTTVKLDFKPERDWVLLPATADVVYPTREVALNILDREQRRLVLSCCNSLSSEHADSLGMVTVTEKLNLPVDMRHMFMKMYLLLMDYNLAVTSKCDQMSVCPDSIIKSYPDSTDEVRLTAVAKHNVVIDTEGFTEEELGLILLASQQYPPVWYAGDNIYNACQMEADDVAFISSRSIHVDKTMRWGSPDRLYHMIWSVAAKLSAVHCLYSAFSEMRGKPKMMADVLKRTDITSVASSVPVSRSYMRAFGDRGGIKYAVSQYPGYFSTSMSLITDLVYGSMFEASATCLVEELGGIGNALSGATPATHRTFNGLLRDYGVDHANLEVNSLLTNWMSLAGSPITWAFGRQLKKYVVALAGEIVHGADILMPQLMELIPYMSSHNTTWGCSRGWRGRVDILGSSSEERKLADQRIASVAWIMGARQSRPKVFRNKLSKTEMVLSQAEYELKAQCSDGCTVENVNLWMGQDVGGRLDENERTSTALIKTEYAGTKCSLVYDREQGVWHIPEEVPLPYSRFVKESFKGAVPKPVDTEIRPVTFGGSPNPNSGFGYLKTIANNKINISEKKTYARTTPDGNAYVAPYLMDDQRMQELQTEYDGEVDSGDEVVFGEVVVPGDGQCAVHAVMEDLKMHGYVGVDSLNRAKDKFSDELTTKYWHDANEIAAVLNNYGFGLDLLDMGETNRLTRYGSDETKHRVGLVRRGNHFNAMKLGKGSNKVRVDHVDKGNLTPEQYAEALEMARTTINFNK
nr:hypothetical protein [Aspergillus terreus chrysovirus 1]